jgi:RhtB (resistance to homoserine/threonine) family protein
MEYLSIFITVAIVHLLAVMSPGPDFILTTQNSIMYSRRTGIFTAIGLGLGILVHVIYSLVGIGLIISQSVILFTVIKYVGAAYLIYIGIKSLLSKKSTAQTLTGHEKADLNPLTAVKMGFITNVTNPKATLFFLSLFTLVITPETPFLLKVLMGIEMSLATAVWFASIAWLFSHSIILKRISTIQPVVEKCMGAILIALGIKVALSPK